MPTDEALVTSINILRQQVREAENRLARAEGALESAKTAFAANKKKLLALGYNPDEDVPAAINRDLAEIRATLDQVEELLYEAERLFSTAES